MGIGIGIGIGIDIGKGISACIGLVRYSILYYTIVKYRIEMYRVYSILYIYGAVRNSKRLKHVTFGHVTMMCFKPVSNL